MLKFNGKGVGAVLLAAAATFLPFGVHAEAALGPQADLCNTNASAVLVQIEGIKSRTGNIRVQLYSNNPKTFLEKGEYLERIELPVTPNGLMNVCVPVPKPGNYAVYVRHDANGNGKSDRSDGGGFSGNPDVSLFDMMAKKKPSMSKAEFSVGAQTRPIKIILNYVQGLSFQPLKQYR
ncbi:DUF2141 domain-containing protein [Rhizorhapis sp. SPR117]|uniref:DUF2141 domain-containing protein n=1 Tax=Rhizorhapis sp. SPR117 TaxID=2912611 RepID=UPI001F35F16C|nr:DUF2141 domain-containing protein [Rhizorhapis sp. SPR117]